MMNFVVIFYFYFLLILVNATYQRTPDTKVEANPAVATLGDVQTLKNYIDQNLAQKLEILENNIFNRIRDVIFSENAKHIQTAQIIHENITHRLGAIENILKTSWQEEIVSKINQQQEVLGKITEIEQKNQHQLMNISAILAKNSSREKCEIGPETTGNLTTSVTSNGSNVSEGGVDTGVSRLLHVTVPSSVRPDPHAWKERQLPEEDELDNYMKNATGCQYMEGRYAAGWQSVSNSTTHEGRWRRRFAVRGDSDADIRVTWSAGQSYRFWIGYDSKMETLVYDYALDARIMLRETPGVMSRERYSQFLYIQLEDGIISFGVLGDSVPWWRHNVTVSEGDVLHMEYNTWSRYGVKLLVCA